MKQGESIVETLRVGRPVGGQEGRPWVWGGSGLEAVKRLQRMAQCRLDPLGLGAKMLQYFCNSSAIFLQYFCNISATFPQYFCNISAIRLRDFAFFGLFQEAPNYCRNIAPRDCTWGRTPKLGPCLARRLRLVGGMSHDGLWKLSTSGSS